MVGVIILGIVIFCVIKACTASSAKRTKQKEQAELSRIKIEQARQKAEVSRMMEEARLWTQKQIAMEKEQMRIAKEQEKQAEVLRKHEEQIRKMELQLEQAQEDIDNILYQKEEQQKYSEFLQEQRDKCVPNSAEFFKWQNKLTVVDQKVYRLDKQMRTAMFKKEQAERQLSA